MSYGVPERRGAGMAAEQGSAQTALLKATE